MKPAASIALFLRLLKLFVEKNSFTLVERGGGVQMSEYVDTYCPECDAEVCARLQSRPATLSVRGESTDYVERVAICPTCGNIIGDSRVEGENLERAYAAYRARHSILSPEEIKSLRDTYGLSLREFSKFLGFGEQTAYRYERGDIPDQTHNNTMLSARRINGAQLLLSQNRPNLSGRSIAKIEQRIQAMTDGAEDEARLYLTLEEREADGPSSINGYRRLDLDRVVALVYAFADKCEHLYWTKLQKVMFFADMVSYERNSCSLTGLTYAHAPRGPIIDRMDEVRLILANRGAVEFQQYGWGEVLVPKRVNSQPFSAEELAFIDEMTDFANTFDTATELSDFSHQLSCWDEGNDGEIIEYTRNNGEVGNAMSDRMKERTVG